MKTLIKALILITVLAVSANADLLKKVSIPENWTIDSTDKQENYSLDNIAVQLYVKQSLTTPTGKLTVDHYSLKTEDLAKQAYDYFFSKQKPVYRYQTVVIVLEGDPVDVKNALRFINLPLLEQVKLVFPDLTENEKMTLATEEKLTEAEIKDAKTRIGIMIKGGLKQTFAVTDSKLKLEAKYYLCKDRNEANVGYKNARIKNTNDLVSYIFAQEFLVELKWVK